MIKRLLIILALALTLAACNKSGITHDPLQEFKGQSAADLYEKGTYALAKGNYTTSIKLLEALDSIYPFGQYSQQTRLDLIYAYYKNGDFSSALAASDRYLHLYPRSSQASYALYMKGIIDMERGPGWLLRSVGADESQRDLGHLKAAFTDFNQLVDRYPHSHYVPDAVVRMYYIRNKLAANEIQVADFYYVRGAYIASADRASQVVLHYQGSPQVIEALAIMTESYQELHLDSMANQTLSLLQRYFPYSPQYQDLTHHQA